MDASDNDRWAALEYEYFMYIAAKTGRHNPSGGQFFRNSVVEAELLHMRILTDVLVGHGNSGNGDLGLGDFLEGDPPATLIVAVDKLRTAYGANVDGTPRWETNKRLAHLTTLRGASHDHAALFAKVEPDLEEAMRLLAETTGREGLVKYFRGNATWASHGQVSSSTASTH